MRIKILLNFIVIDGNTTNLVMVVRENCMIKHNNIIIVTVLLIAISRLDDPKKYELALILKITLSNFTLARSGCKRLPFFYFTDNHMTRPIVYKS
jgi:hypothetical protein